MPPRKVKVVETALPDNAIAKQSIDAIRQIEREAVEKKQALGEQLKAAKVALMERLRELEHQLAQIEKAAESISGRGSPAAEGGGERRNLKEVRQRVERWMDGHKGEKLAPADLVKEFPELEGVSMSVFLKPLVEEGKVHTDASGGSRRLKYFVPES
jgi:hypothetical protein